VFSLPAVIIEQYRTTQSQIPSQAFALYRRNRCKGEVGHPEDNLHGSGSTFYGSDAIGGAVNFITQQPSRSEVAIRVGGGTFNATEQHLRADWVNQSHGFLKAEKLTSSSLNQSFPTIRSYQSGSSGRIGQCAPAFVAFLATLAMCFQ